MDFQYYKRLLISIIGIYTVYLNYGLVQEKMFVDFIFLFISSYRYVSPDGSKFTYTSVLLLLQCSINLLIAFFGTLLCLSVNYRFSHFWQRAFSLPFTNSQRRSCWSSYYVEKSRKRVGWSIYTLIHRELCTIKDITVDGQTARMSFELTSGDVLDKVIRNPEVCSQFCCGWLCVGYSFCEGQNVWFCHLWYLLYSGYDLFKQFIKTCELPYTSSCQVMQNDSSFTSWYFVWKWVYFNIYYFTFGMIYCIARRYSVKKYISVFVMTAGIVSM